MFRTCYFIWDTLFGTFSWFNNHIVAHTKVTTRDKTFEAISKCFRASLLSLRNPLVWISSILCRISLAPTSSPFIQK